MLCSVVFGGFYLLPNITRADFEAKMLQMGFGPMRGGGRALHFVKRCPDGCPTLELWMDPTTDDEQVLGLLLADAEARDCGHQRLRSVVDKPDQPDQLNDEGSLDEPG